MNIRVEPHLLSSELCQELLFVTEVVSAKQKIDQMSKGSVYFTIPLTTTIKDLLFYRLGLDVQKADIPMRWIKGDIMPHEDVGKNTFDDTYLVYVTDSEGELIVDSQHFPIQSGTAYVFSEGLSHETVRTGETPRLLLGPMSEFAEPVGISGIYGDGGTTAYLRYQSGTLEFTNDRITWYTVFFPCGLVNTNTSLGFFTIELDTDITLTTINDYFVLLSSDIQIGSRTLKTDGTRPRIVLDGIANYPGIFQNGTQYGNGQNNLRIYNLVIDSIGSTSLDPYGGWLGQSYFGKAASSNIITNCFSSGEISPYSGGILGSYAADSSGNVRLVGCGSNGLIGLNAGGIVGSQAANNNGTVTCFGCYSSGFIQNNAGGIMGRAAQGGTIERCYSTGSIDGYAGGLVGSNAVNVFVTASYSIGNIAFQGGGIIGDVSDYVTVTNSYSLGNAGISAGGIYGANAQNFTINHCYTTGTVSGGTGYMLGQSNFIPSDCYAEGYGGGSGWNSVNANATLQGQSAGVVGAVWVKTVPNQPYELHIGYTPYQRTNISAAGELIMEYNVAVQAGGTIPAAIIPNKSYTMLEILQIVGTGGQVGVTVNPNTGAIYIEPETTKGATFQIHIRNEGSYHITAVNAEILNDVTCCSIPVVWTNTTPQDRCDILTGNAMLGGVQNGPMSYDAYLALLKSRASRTFS